MPKSGRCSSINSRRGPWQGARGDKLLEAAEQHLRAHQVVLPARSTIDRIISRATTQAEEDLLLRLQARLGGNLCSRIEELLTVPEGEQRSTLARLKEYPPEPHPAVINLFMEFDDAVLREALAACRELHAIADHG